MRAKYTILHNQTKLSNMGEMIHNIAHQLISQMKGNITASNIEYDYDRRIYKGYCL